MAGTTAEVGSQVGVKVRVRARVTVGVRGRAGCSG